MKLYIVPVPIGNLGDITLRAIETLKDVDFIIVEDTKYSLKLLNHLGIKKALMSYYKPKEKQKSHKIIERLKSENAALITDSGTPVISDPGNFLIRKAIEAGIAIESLPGPTAFVPALTLSGIDFKSFVFLGFPPRKNGELERFLRKYSKSSDILVFYESPKRVENLLKITRKVFGNREFALVKELTKKNEKILRGNLDEYESLLEGTKLLGEFVLILGGAIKNEEEKLEINSLDDIYAYFKNEHNISKNKIKNIIMKRHSEGR